MPAIDSNERKVWPLARQGRSIFLILLIASGCAQTDPAVRELFKREKEPVSVVVREPGDSVPLVHDVDGRPYVEVTVGNTDLLLLVDTGAPLLVLDSNIASALNLKLSPEKFQIATPEGLALCQAAVIPELRVGSATIHGITTAFMDFSSGNNPFGSVNDRPIHGILGGAILPALKSRIDFGDHRLILKPNDLPARTTAVSLQKGKGFRRYVAVEINGILGLFVIDSGANTIVLDQSFARESGVSIGWSGHIQTLGIKVPTPARRVVSGRIAELRIGPVSFTNAPAFIDESSYADETKNAGQRVIGFLGSRFLSEHRMVIDYGRDSLFMRLNN